jgi:lambda family phage tail tape measure protein
MANQVKIDLSLQDTSGSIKKRTSEVQGLNSELTRSQSLASKSTSKAVASSFSATSENTAYGQARGSMGVTGASARDFANQAQGLGGLVRLYATYAANLFAVTAAFQALSQAMNTTNMVKGLDQLGAASGTALGTLAKSFTDASGGAISFRESMEATTKAVSSGMSQAQFLKLGDVAKKASQALGIGMSDAVSRLTRGITKLEPELLDELGIFTKVGKATEDYARSVGKSADALTDFERRQAFANAVLAEGASKFGEIDIPTNPYDKLLASLKNIGQQILEVINKGLAPLVNILSSSPTALSVLIAGLAATIIKQALPAIGQYRSGLRDAAEEAKNMSEARAAYAKLALDKVRAIQAKEILAEKDKFAQIADAQVDASQKTLEKISKKGISKQVKGILDKPEILSITDKDLAVLDRLGSKQTAISATYRQLAQTIREAKKANEDYALTEAKLEQRAQTAPGMFSAAGIAASRAESARKKAASSQIVSNAGEVAAIEGIGSAFSNMLSSIKGEKLGALKGTLTGIAGAANILTTAISGIMSVLSRLLGWVGVVITAYQLLSSWLSKNSKEAEKYTGSLTTLTEATKSAASTNLKYLDSLSVNSIVARTNAFTSLSDAISSTVDSLQEVTSKASLFDTFVDRVYSLFGGGVKNAFAEGISSSVSEGLKTISDPKLKQNAETRLKTLLDIKDVSGSTIKDALGGLSEKELISVGGALKSLFKDIATEAEKATAPLRSLKEGFDALDKSYQELANSLLNKDPATKFALDLIKQSELLKDAFKSPQSQVAILKELLEDTSKIKFFPPETQESILESARLIQKLSADIASANEQIALGTQKVKASGEIQGSSVPVEVVTRLRIEGEALLVAGTEAHKQATQKLSEIKTNLTSGLNTAMERGFRLIEAPLSRALASASIDTQKVLLSSLPKTPEIAKMQAQLDIQAIELRKQEITSLRDLTNEVKLSRLSSERARLEDQKAKFVESGDIASAKELSKQIDKTKQQELAITNPVMLRKQGGELSAESATILAERAGYMAQIAALSQQQQAALINGVVSSVSAGFAIQKEALQRDLDTIKAENQQFLQSQQFLQLPVAEQERERFRRSQQETQKASEVTNIGLREQIGVTGAIAAEATARGYVKVAEEAKKANQTAQENLAIAQKSQGVVQAAAATESNRTITLNEQLRVIDKQLEAENSKYKLADLQKSLQSDRLSAELTYLDTLKGLGAITEQDYADRAKIITSKQLELENSKKLLDLENARSAAVQELNKRILQTRDPEEITRLKSLKASTETYYNTAKSGEQELYTLKLKNKDLMDSLTERQKGYEQVIKGSFERMGDALADFVSTGKFNFKDLANSMLQEILRIEMRMAVSSAWAALRPAIGAFLGNILPSAAPTSTIPGANLDNFFNAKGAAYDYGVQKFAKGGAFTNQIVASPTLFKFAKGAGMMGEAGPEAIMPLTRDGQGNLGVRAAGQGGGNVDIVVNNYSGEKAEATESVDSRGNRKIEVVIGEMSASDISKTGSASQKNLRSTYGIRPQLIRR